NPTAEGPDWERPASIELLDPGRGGVAGPGFQIDAGLRIQGGNSRVPANQPKHAFRALFKKKYGPGKLDFPLFGAHTGKLDTVVFRSTYNNSWTHWDPAQHHRADYVRDGFARLTQRDMGHPAVRQRYAHLYLNGLYWGLYDLTDRPADAWAAAVVGGKRDHYSIVNSGEPVSGPPTKTDPKGTTRAAADWRALFEAVRKDMTVPAHYHDVTTRLVEPTALADYMIQQFFAGNLDWDFHNYYAYRDTDPAAKVKGWRFVSWDSERTLENLDDNVTGVNTTGHPTEVFRRLMTNPDFKRLFADRAHRALTNDGPLTPAKNIARYKSLADQIQNAVVAESARWGDNRGGPYTRATWRAETTRLLTTYLPARTDRVAKQFATAGFTPAIAPPTLTPHGGKVPPGHTLSITPPAGTIVHYTTDGVDPRVPATATTPGGAISPAARAYDPANRPALTASTPVKARARSAKGEWSALTEATFVMDPAPPK
ncbi:MAG TPA: CotH kinase family protein, partial [Tepidisphaeraceae bacterium]|nr:CotH kinase family protein [Tepidisphaeraceae bacterium]